MYSKSFSLSFFRFSSSCMTLVIPPGQLPASNCWIPAADTEESVGEDVEEISRHPSTWGTACPAEYSRSSQKTSRTGSTWAAQCWGGTWCPTRPQKEGATTCSAGSWGGGEHSSSACPLWWCTEQDWEAFSAFETVAWTATSLLFSVPVSASRSEAFAASALALARAPH